MKPIIFLLVFLLLGSAVGFGIGFQDTLLPNEFGPVTDPKLAWTSQTQQLGTPKAAVIDGEVYEFGTMEVDATESHAFLIKNEGDAPLVLEKGGTTCKCTLSELENGEVQPGQTVKVTLEWTPKSISLDFGQTATLLTNDPERPSLELRIRGKVVRAIVLEPRSILVTSLSAGETYKTGIRVLSFNTADFEIQSAEISGSHEKLMTATFRPLTDQELAESEAKAGYFVQVEIIAGLPLGKSHHDLKIKTSSKEMPELVVPVDASVVGDITVIAQHYSSKKNLLQLGKIPHGEGITRRIYLIVKGEHRNQVKFGKPQSNPDYLKIEVGEPEEISDGRVLKFPVLVEVPTSAPAGNYVGPKKDALGNISIPVDGHPAIPEVDLGVYLAVE